MSVNPTEQTVIKPLGMFSFHREGEEKAERKRRCVQGLVGRESSHGEREHLLGFCISLAVRWHQLIEFLVNTAQAPCVYAIFAL